MTNGIWPNDGSHIYKEELEKLRESVRRMLIPVLKRCADHPMRCDYSDDANIALTTFLAENKEFETK